MGKHKTCPNCGGKVVARPGIDGIQFYCTNCRRRVWKDTWRKKDFVEIGSAHKNV